MVGIIVAPPSEFRRICREARKVDRQNARLTERFGFTDIARDNPSITASGVHNINDSVVDLCIRFVIIYDLISLSTHNLLHGAASVLFSAIFRVLVDCGLGLKPQKARWHWSSKAVQ